jgi:hypothetical protein
MAQIARGDSMSHFPERSLLFNIAMIFIFLASDDINRAPNKTYHSPRIAVNSFIWQFQGKQNAF